MGDQWYPDDTVLEHPLNVFYLNLFLYICSEMNFTWITFQIWQIIVFWENGLENTEVILSHFESNFIENIDKLSISWILAHVKRRWLETFSNHIISIQNFLRQYDQNRINFLIIKKPNIFQFENFTHQKVFESLIILLRILQKWNRIFIFKWNSLWKISGAIII